MALITERENDYVVKVKKNQKKLFENIEQTVILEKLIDNHTTEEKNRGRKEQRIIEVYTSPLAIQKEWPKAKSIVYIQRTSVRKGKKTTTDSFYLSSLELSAKEMAAGIRAHWNIENTLHYVKDVVTHEDDIRIKQSNAASILAIIRNLTLSIFRINGHPSIKCAIRSYGGNLNFLFPLIE